MPTTPIQLLTVPADTLRDEQWDLAVLLMQALSRPLTIEEVALEIHKLRSVLVEAKVSWTTIEEPTVT